MAKTYLPNLDAVRGIAASLVIIGHIEGYKREYGITTLLSEHVSASLGGLGVTLFFVLSGYLITYLLLFEKHRTGSIKISFFYLRRILRIWPLFFLVLFAGYIFTGFDRIEWVWLNLVFMTNIALIFKLLPHVIQPIWSIGVEEQFYLFWPRFLSFKHVSMSLKAIVIFLLAFWFLKLAAILEDWIFLRDWLYWTRFDCMALGSLSAFVAYHHFYPFLKGDWFSRLTSPFAQIFFMGIFISLCIDSFLLEHLMIHQLFAGSFAVILLNLSLAEKKLLRLESPVLNFLGKISYGLYLLHLFVIQIVIAVGKPLWLELPHWLTEILIYSLSFGFSIGLAYLSYQYFESYFLKLKNRFSVLNGLQKSRTTS